MPCTPSMAVSQVQSWEKLQQSCLEPRSTLALLQDMLAMRDNPGLMLVSTRLSQMQQYLSHPASCGLAVSVLSACFNSLALLQVGKSYASAKEAIIMTGTFLLEQLKQMDSAAGGKATFTFGGTAFVTALTSEVHSQPVSLPAFTPFHLLLYRALLDMTSLASILYVHHAIWFKAQQTPLTEVDHALLHVLCNVGCIETRMRLESCESKS